MWADARDRLVLTDRPADDYLPWDRHAGPDLIMLRDGSHLATLRLDGKPLDLLDPPARRAERRRRHGVLRALAGPNITLFEHLVSYTHATPFRPARYQSAYAGALMADYAHATDAGLLERAWFLTILARPSGLAGLWQRLSGASAQEDETLARAVNERAAMVEQALPDYLPRRLGVRHQGGVAFSEIAEAMRLVLYARWLPVPLPDGPLAGAIYTDRVVCSRRGFDVQQPGRPSLGMMFGLRDYPEKVPPGLLDSLALLRRRLVMTNRFEYLSRGKVTDKLGLRETQMANARDRATSLAEGLADIMDDVASGRGLMGDHHWSLAVHVDQDVGDPATSLRRLDEAAGDVRAALVNAGLNATPESWGCEPAFWAQVPGAPKLVLARHGAISGYNHIGFSPLAGHPRGEARGQWGAPTLRFRTLSGTAHDFTPHVNGVGHAILLGPTGCGKTTLLGLFGASLDPVTAQRGGAVFLLDADGSNELLVLACGGTYAKVRRGVASGAAPLKALPNTPEAIAWLVEFTLGLIAADGAGLPPPDQVERIEKGIAFLLRKPPGLRSFAGLRQFMDHAPGGAGERLERWCRGGSLGWAFDGEADLIRSDAGLCGIDNTEILVDDAAAVREPMAAYQLYRIGERVGTGVPSAVLADEGQAYLPGERFAAGFERFITRLRKGNGLFWLATQQPQHISRHRIGQTLISNAPTKLLFPNPAAEVAAYRDDLHCTDGEIAAVQERMLTQGRGAFLVKRDSGSFIARADLTGLPDHVAILSGTPNRRRLARQIIEQVGPEPERWVPEYRRRYQEADL